MGKLNTAKQQILDAWATDAAKGVDVGKAEVAEDGTVTKQSASVTMMESLQGELTESVLDAAMAKAKTANPKPIEEPEPLGEVIG